jgi:membrane-bound lytic murein transglycosylase D
MGQFATATRTMKRLMASHRNTTLLLRGALALACAPLLFALAGCPGDTTSATAAPGSVPAKATAPQVSAAQQATQQQQDAAALAAQHAKKVQDTIDRSEANYRAGVENYNANHLDAARLDFDAAVDGMLSSGLDLKDDPQMADEFDHLLSAINSLEMVALKQGNGFSPAVEAAPLDAANEVTFPSDPALVGRVAAEIKTTQSDFPLVVNDYVAGWISYFSSSPAGHAHLKASLERAGKYKDMISKILRDNGVPQDLIYQAVAESGFQPQALNRSSGAGGMWQFMPFGNYGLIHNGYFDERFDPEKSTIAYAKYMKYLYNQFGDWYLAMAAYDWGPGNVQRAVSRTGYADYWELYKRGRLPAETKAYVPGIIAAMIMAKNPAQYGLTNLVPDPPVLSDTVTTSYAIDLRLVADLTESTVPEIVALNPALLRLMTPRDISYDLHVPPGTRNEFLDRLKDIPEENRASWRFHVVKPGETLDQIATALHGHATEIAQYNDVTSSQPLQTGDELIVPVAAVSSAATGQQHYTPGRRDTLITVADRFGITVEQLREWNHLTSNRITPGHSLYVAEPVRLAPGMRSSRSRSTSHSRSAHGSSHVSQQAAHGNSHLTRSTARTSTKSTAAHRQAAPTSAANKNRQHSKRPVK